MALQSGSPGFESCFVITGDVTWAVCCCLSALGCRGGGIEPAFQGCSEEPTSRVQEMRILRRPSTLGPQPGE